MHLIWLVLTCNVVQASIYQHLHELQGRVIPCMIARAFRVCQMFGLLATQLVPYAADGATFGPDDCRAAMAGLKEIHDQGVLHGDIHPGNIVINRVRHASAFSCRPRSGGHHTLCACLVMCIANPMSQFGTCCNLLLTTHAIQARYRGVKHA